MEVTVEEIFNGNTVKAAPPLLHTKVGVPSHKAAGSQSVSVRSTMVTRSNQERNTKKYRAITSQTLTDHVVWAYGLHCGQWSRVIHHLLSRYGCGTGRGSWTRTWVSSRYYTHINVHTIAFDKIVFFHEAGVKEVGPGIAVPIFLHVWALTWLARKGASQHSSWIQKHTP